MNGETEDARKERERTFHDERFAEEVRGGTSKYYEVDAGKARYRELVSCLGAGRRVLEYGCGLGSEAFGLAAVGSSVTAIDISEVAIRKAAEQAQQVGLLIEFVEMDAESLDLADGSFDLVCGSGILHHLDLDLALGEVARVLRPDGRAVFMEPLGTNPLINLYRRLTPAMRTVDEHPLVESDLALARRSFGSVEAEVFNLSALAAVPFRRLPGGARLISVLHRFDRWLFRRSSIARRLAWVVVIRLGEPRR